MTNKFYLTNNFIKCKSRTESQDFVSVARMGGGEDELEMGEEITVCGRWGWMETGERHARKIRSTDTHQHSKV